MNRLSRLAALTAVALSTWTASARADVAPDPCTGGKQGDPCRDLHAREGLCEPDPTCATSPGQCLICVADPVTGHGGAGGHPTSTSSGSTAVASSSASGHGGAGPVAAPPPAAPPSVSSCAVAHAGRGGEAPAAVLLSLVGVALLLASRRVGRPTSG